MTKNNAYTRFLGPRQWALQREICANIKHQQNVAWLKNNALPLQSAHVMRGQKEVGFARKSAQQCGCGIAQPST
jgi:hypothetical protein